MDYDRLKAEATARRAGQEPVCGARGAVVDVGAFERRVALRNLGRVDPGSIEDYIVTCDGYSGLHRALSIGREGVIAELEKAGLRGRGGAGYLTALKWRTCREAEADEKFVVCDAIDAHPWTRTAQTLLGGDPHSVLEGLLIGAYAVGAAQCFLCVNADYREQIALLRDALDRMRDCGLLGHGILSSEFSCDVEVCATAGSLVAGEETALIRILEGKQALPYLRFEYPAVQGLHEKPTLVNNLETLAVVSALLQGRAGAPMAGDTKIVTICGDVEREMTVEVPLGMSIGALLEGAEGASLGELGVKAVQFGGPTGAFFAAGSPASGGVGGSLDTPITFEHIEAAGSVMGSATLRVVGGGPDGVCAVQMARDAMAYLQEQSCGKCTSCREGTLQLVDMLDDILDSRATAEDLELMLELCEAMRTGSICGLGKNAGAPLLSALTLFGDDFDAHLHDGHCPAKE